MNEIKAPVQPAENEISPSCPLRPRRTLKIENLGDAWRGKLFAGIRLKGQWLVSAGFHPGSRVAVTVTSPGVMQLRVVGEQTADEAESKPNPSPDLKVVCDGSVSLFQPLSDKAREWMDAHCPAGPDHQYFCGALVAEARYVDDLLAHAVEDGLSI